MIKFILVLILSLNSAAVLGQILESTEWVRIGVVRSDSNYAVGGLAAYTYEGSLVYHFEKGVVGIATQGQYYSEHKYSAKDQVLTIGPYLRFVISSLSADTLVLTELLDNNENVAATFVKSDVYYQQLLKNGQVKILADTLILANRDLSPVCKQKDLFRRVFTPRDQPREVSGHFIVNANGVVNDVQIEQNNGFSRREHELVIKMLKQKSVSWLLPNVGRPMNFKVKFSLQVEMSIRQSDVALYSTRFDLHQD